MPPAHFLKIFGHHDPSPIPEPTPDDNAFLSVRTPPFSLHPSAMNVFSLSRHSQLRRRHTFDLVAGHARDVESDNMGLLNTTSSPGIGLENMANPLFLLPHQNRPPPVALGYRLPFIILAAITGVIIVAASIAVMWLYRGKARPKLRMFQLKAKTRMTEKNLSWAMMRSSMSIGGSKAVLEEKAEAESILKRVTVVLDRMSHSENDYRNEKYAVLQPQLPPLAVLRHDVPGARHRRRSLPIAETHRKSKAITMTPLPRLPSLAPSPALFTISEDEERRAAERLLQASAPGSPVALAPSPEPQAQQPSTRSSSVTKGLGFIAGMANVIIDAASTSLASLSSLESIDLIDQIYDGIEPPSASTSQTPVSKPSILDRISDRISFASTPTPSASESHSCDTDNSLLFTPSLESDLADYQVQRVEKLQHLSADFKRASLVSFPEVAVEGSQKFPAVVVTTSPSIAEMDVRRASIALEMAAASSQSSTATASTYACLDDFPAPPETRRSLSEEIASSLPSGFSGLWRKSASVSDPDLTRSAAEEKEREKEAGFVKLVRASGPPRLSGLGLGFSFL